MEAPAAERSAMMPDPITVATRMAVPKASASSRRVRGFALSFIRRNVRLKLVEILMGYR